MGNLSGMIGPPIISRERWRCELGLGAVRPELARPLRILVGHRRFLRSIESRSALKNGMSTN
jgi:hypothetical protein